MKFGSVCSGIEAASVAWEPLGWEAAWFSEIEPFPCAVLAHHYPSVPNHGDMTLLPDRILSGEISAPDIFCGGTPCQAFSVAGLRRSLEDDRGNLSLTFCEIANAIDSVRSVRGEPPCIVFWENVPGVLNTPDNAFGCFLAGLAGEDDPLIPSGKKWTNAGCVFGPKRAIAWRVTDAQYFGVAQRRRRVFVVASARDGFDPTAVLFEFNGLRRDTAPSRKAWQKPAPTVVSGPPFSRTGNERVECEAIVAQCLTTGTGKRYDDETETILVTPTHYRKSRRAQSNKDHETWVEDDTTNTLNCFDLGDVRTVEAIVQPMCFQQNTRDEVRYINGDGQIAGALAAESGMKQTNYVAQPITQYGDIAGSLTARHDSSPCADRGQNMVAQPIAFHATQDPISGPIAPALGANMYAGVAVDVYNQTVDGDTAATLTEACGGSNTSGPKVMQPIAFNGDQSEKTRSMGESVDMTPTLRADGPCHVATPAVSQPIAWSEELTPSVDVAGTIQHGGQGGRHDGVMQTNMAVRRLTPTECERLQGFPDGYTNIPWRGKSEAPDGPRYKALGNSWAVPNVRWIGTKIDLYLKGDL